MNIFARAAFSAVLRKLETLYKLSGEELNALATVPTQVAECRSEQVLVREGDRPWRCCSILEGFACSFKSLRNGQRQITAFHIPGDMPDLQSLHHKVADTGIAAITSCTVAFIEHEVVRDLCARYPCLANSFWRETLNDASIHREWVTNIGQRDASSRIAHLACEFLTRMQAAGLAENHTCRFPITQAELADATGMSSVHVNRSLQHLRASGLISLKGEQLSALDWPALKNFAGFDPSYLHLDESEQQIGPVPSGCR